MSWWKILSLYQPLAKQWTEQISSDIYSGDALGHLTSPRHKHNVMFIISLTHMNVWESMGKPCSCIQFVFLVQITWESVSGTASHSRYVWTCNEIEGLYNKIIITIVPSYYWKNHLFVAIGIVTCALQYRRQQLNLVIFSSIALYYGDTYIFLWGVEKEVKPDQQSWT